MSPCLPVPPALDTARDALFLDFDGTLVEIADTPGAIRLPDGLPDLLRRASERLAGRLAIVSGRSIATLDRFGMTGIACAGSHGAEWRLADGERRTQTPPRGLEEARTRFASFAKGREGVLFEDKPLGAALHYRLAEEREAQEACHALASTLAQEYDLHVQHGHDMVELRGHGFDKGSAILALLSRAPFAGFRPVFLGDDVTDEAGFAAVRNEGGHGVLIGSPRETAARYRLEGPENVNDWLSRSLGD